MIGDDTHYNPAWKEGSLDVCADICIVEDIHLRFMMLLHNTCDSMIASVPSQFKHAGCYKKNVVELQPGNANWKS